MVVLDEWWEGGNKYQVATVRDTMEVDGFDVSQDEKEIVGCEWMWVEDERLGGGNRWRAAAKWKGFKLTHNGKDVEVTRGTTRGTEV